MMGLRTMIITNQHFHIRISILYSQTLLLQPFKHNEARWSILKIITNCLPLPFLSSNSVWRDYPSPVPFPISVGLNYPANPGSALAHPLPCPSPPMELPWFTSSRRISRPLSIGFQQRCRAGKGREGQYGKSISQLFFNAGLALGVAPPVQANHDYRLLICATGKPKMICERETVSKWDDRLESKGMIMAPHSPKKWQDDE